MALQQSVVIPAGNTAYAAVLLCPSGKVSLGGGYSRQSGSEFVTVTDSYPTYSTSGGVSTSVGWTAVASNPTDTDGTLTMRVICANPS